MQRKIKQVIAKSLNDQGKYIHDYGYCDDRGYYSWPDFILRQNVITTRVIQQSEINILEKPLSAFAAQGWFPEDVIITFHSEKKDTATLANAVTILDSRSRLIEQALFLKEPMQIMLNGGLAISISLSSFSYPLIEAAAYLIAQASKMATTTGKARMNPCDMSNPKYQMRSWLLRLGFIGKEFERPRKTLLEGLPGDMAFFNEEQKKIAVAKRKAQKLNGFSVKEKGA